MRDSTACLAASVVFPAWTCLRDFLKSLYLKKTYGYDQENNLIQWQKKHIIALTLTCVKTQGHQWSLTRNPTIQLGLPIAV